MKTQNQSSGEKVAEKSHESANLLRHCNLGFKVQRFMCMFFPKIKRVGNQVKVQFIFLFT